MQHGQLFLLPKTTSVAGKHSPSFIRIPPPFCSFTRIKSCDITRCYARSHYSIVSPKVKKIHRYQVCVIETIDVNLLKLLICLRYVFVHWRHVCVLALKQLISSSVLQHLSHRSEVTTLVQR